jgi:hypothetical protein
MSYNILCKETVLRETERLTRGRAAGIKLEVETVCAIGLNRIESAMKKFCHGLWSRILNITTSNLRLLSSLSTVTPHLYFTYHLHFLFILSLYASPFNFNIHFAISKFVMIVKKK